jgi:translocation and assembly module TamB
MNLRHPARWALALLLLLGGVLLGVYLLRGVILYPHLKRAAIAFFEDDLDLQLELGAIRGSLLGGIEFDDVRISTPPSADTPLDVRIGALRARYHLLDLLQGVDTFLGETKVVIDHPRALIDLSRPPSETPSGDGPEASGGWPAVLPRIAVLAGELELKGDGYGSRFSGIWLDPSDREDAAAGFQLGIEDWRWHLPPLRDGRVKAGAGLVLDPSGRLTIHGLTLNSTEVVEAGTVDLSQLPRRLSFEARVPPRDGRLVVTGRHDDDRLQLSIDGEGVDLALVEQILEMPPQDIAGKVAVTTDLLLPYAQPEAMRATIEVRAGSGHWQSFAWDHGLFKARAAEGLLHVPQAEWIGQGNSGRIRDLSLPMAALFDGQIDQLLAGLSTDFDLSLHKIPALTVLWDVDTHQAAAAVPTHHLVLGGRIQEGLLQLTQGRLTCGESQVNVNRLQVDLAALTEKRRDTSLEVEADLNVPELSVFADLLPLPPIAGRLEGHLTLTGPLGKPRGNFGFKGENLYLAGVRLGALDVASSSDGEWLRVEGLALRNGNDRAILTGRIRMASGALEKTQGTAQISDIGDYINPLLPAEWPAEGEINLQATIAGTLVQPELQAAFTVTKARLGELSAGKVRAVLQASPNQLAIERIDVNAAPGDVTLAGRMDFGNDDRLLAAELTRFSLQKNEATLHLSDPVQVVGKTDHGWRITPLVLEGTAGHIAISGRFGGGDPTDLKVDLAGIQADPWLAEFGGPVRALQGLDARLRVSGTAAAPHIDLSGDLSHLEVREWPHPLQGQFDFLLDGGGIAIRRWTWTDGATQQMSATGRIPMAYRSGWQDIGDTMRLRIDLTMGDLMILKDAIPDLPIAGGRLQARVDLGGTLAAPIGTLQSTLHELLLTPSLEGQPQGPFEGEALLHLHERGADLKELRIDSALMSIQGEGRLRVDETAGLRALRTGQWPRGAVDGTLKVSVPDLGWLTAMLPGVRRIAGRLNGALTIAGPMQGPAVKADLSLKEGSLQPEGDAPPLEAVQADLVADGGQVVLRSCRGEIGGAPFQITGALRKTEDGTWATDFRFNGTNLLLYRTADIRVRADTDLHLTGPVEKMALQGDVGLTNSRFRRNVDIFGFLKSAPPSAGSPSEVLFSLPDPPLKDMTFGVNIDSKTPFELANNVARGGLRPHLHLGGTGELPLLTGDVYLDPIRLRLPAGIMTIQSGVLRFLPSRANRPVMDLQGEGKVFDYDITALIEGPLDEPQVTLSSSPPLPGDQLMLMLLTGRPPADKNSAKNRGVPMNLAVYIGQDLLLQWFGGDSTESWTSILDRFDVTVGRRVTRAGDETLEAQFRLGEDVIRDGDSIYITGERDVFDFYNAGVKFVFRFK